MSKTLYWSGKAEDFKDVKVPPDVTKIVVDLIDIDFEYQDVFFYHRREDGTCYVLDDNGKETDIEDPKSE